MHGNPPEHPDVWGHFCGVCGQRHSKSKIQMDEYTRLGLCPGGGLYAVDGAPTLLHCVMRGYRLNHSWA
jgi:hypothetical protein